MSNLIKLANKFKIKYSSTFMYEPEEYQETDQDRDFETFWNDWLDEIKVMDYEELYKEKRKIENLIEEKLEEDNDNVWLQEKQLKIINQQIKKV